MHAWQARDQQLAQAYPLLRLGFRPFYLAAAAFALLAIPAWLLHHGGSLTLPGYLGGMLWHGHEMVYGFGCAVIVGFLFTAVRTWTGQVTPSGATLAGFFLLWLTGRIALLVLPPIPAMLLDVSFLPLAAWALLRCLLKANNRRNLFVPVMLLGLAVLNLLFHLAAQGHIAYSPLSFLHGAINLVTLLEVVIAGRVVPMFTANAAPGTQQYRRAWLDKAVPATTLLAFVASQGNGPLVLLVCLLAAALQLVRWLGWGPQGARGKPLLWVLHIAYLWVPLGLIGMGLAAIGLASPILVTHAFAAGGMAGLIIGMITRTALGHTGRLLQAGKVETLAYAAISIAALVRMLPLLYPAVPNQGALLWLAGGLWVAGFAAYLYRYVPYMFAARLDGKPG